MLLCRSQQVRISHARRVYLFFEASFPSSMSQARYCVVAKEVPVHVSTHNEVHAWRSNAEQIAEMD